MLFPFSATTAEAWDSGLPQGQIVSGQKKGRDVILAVRFLQTYSFILCHGETKYSAILSIGD